jgi:protein TonB
MRVAIAISTSALAHLGLIGALAVWIIPIARWHVEYEVARGDSVVQISVPPAIDVPVKMEATPTEQPVHEPPPAPPVETPPVSTSQYELPPIDAVETVRTEVEPPPIVENGEVPVPVPPPTLAEVEIEPQPSEEASPDAAEQPASRPVARLPTDQDFATSASVAVLLQSAVVVGAKVDELPRKLPRNPVPNYPIEAAVAGLEGRVMLRVLVLADGSVDAARVETTSGLASFDESALDAVRRWRFSPARRSGTAVAYEVLVPVRFSIRRG